MMLPSVFGFAGTKAALLLAIGALVASAVGAAAATGNVPNGGQGDEHGKKAQATATATVTATTTATAVANGQNVEIENEHPGLTGRCNAITRGSGQGRENKAQAPAFQDLDCNNPTSNLQGGGNTGNPNPGQGNPGNNNPGGGNPGNNPGGGNPGNNNPGGGNGQPGNPGQGNPNPGGPAN
jgi:hypothetical protein